MPVIFTKKNEQILITSDKAARFVTGIEGWVDRHGRFFGTDEQIARWSGCTHIVCPNCGNPSPKGYTICFGCREKKAIERYKTLERKLFGGGGVPVYSESADRYFFCNEEIEDFIEDSFDLEADIKTLRLVLCEPIYLRSVNEDYFGDELAEDEELSEAVTDALDNLNAVIRDEGPVSWVPGKYAADILLNREPKQTD